MSITSPVTNPVTQPRRFDIDPGETIHVKLADFPEKEHLAGDGNWLYKIPFRDDWAVLKVYYGNRNPLLHVKKTFSNLLLTGRTSHMPRARCRTEIESIRVWESHGFRCFPMYPEVVFDDLPAGGYILFDYVPGEHFRTHFRDTNRTIDERLETLRAWLPEWHRRHRAAIDNDEPRLIQENGDAKHVMLWEGDWINFDLELCFRSHDIRDLIGREMLAFFRSIGKCFKIENHDKLMGVILESYPDRSLLMETYLHAIRNHNPVVRAGRLIERSMKGETGKVFSKYWIAFDLKRRLDETAVGV
jgi:hypothetical protein